MALTDSLMKLILPLSDGVLEQIEARTSLRSRTSVRRWLKTGYPRLRAPRPDLVGELSGGDLLHVENQSRNDPTMPYRMLEYYLAIREHHGRHPIQVVLYYGPQKMRMPDRIQRPELNFRYTIVDIRELDGERLIRSGSLGDNILAILARVRDERIALRRVLKRIAGLPDDEGEKALAALSTLAGLRKLEPTMQREMQGMLTFEVDLMKNKIFGPPLRKALSEGRAKGRAEGRVEGRAEGRKEGRAEGERAVLARQIEKRFGALSTTARRRLSKLTPKEIEDAAIRIFECRSVKELLG
ncbi:MAG: Rpn family recombination-promoting nuclease/putative transposase [Acidobacteriota bacterium]|nr:Rpn family recombination-promoting nuclease/putative transposase [Acidobacteriota bacterium]